MERKGCVVELLQQQQQPKHHHRAASTGLQESSSSSSEATRCSDSIRAIDSKMSRHEQSDAGENKAANVNIQFPWISEFRRQCRSLPRGPSALIKLITFFKRNVSSNVNDCYKKSTRAAKLKELIKEALLLFVYFRRSEQPQDQNRAVYLGHMSDLLAMYIDLELLASERVAAPQVGKISARLVSCLYVCLEKSAEHMLDTLIKVQLMVKDHRQILEPAISKIFKMIPVKPEPEVMYVRYLLVFKLWKNLYRNRVVRRQIHISALASLDLPNLATSQTSNFYLRQGVDLRKACTKFLQYCRQSGDAEEVDSSPAAAGDITERDQRLKITITSQTNKVESVNNEFSKSSSSVEKSSSLKNVMNIPFAKLDINDSKTSCSTGSNLVKNKKLDKSAVLRKSKTLKEKLDEIAFIDLTDEEVTKIVKRKKRRSIDWLEDLKDVKRLTALKRERDVGRKLKERENEQILEEEIKNSFRRSIGEYLSAETMELESKSYPNTQKNSESDSNLTAEQTVDSVEPTKPISSPPISSTSKLVCYDSDSVPEKCDSNEKSVAEDDFSVSIEASDSTVVSSSKALMSEEKEEKVSALHDADVALTDDKSQPADSTVPNADSAKEESSSSGEKLTRNCSVIREHSNAVAPVAAAEQAEPKKMMENQTVNFNSTKTDNYPNEQKVQQALTKERRSLSSINESHPLTEKPKDKKYKSVNNEKVKAKRSPSRENRSSNTSVKQPQASSSEVPTMSNGYYDIPESDIDGLTLLASVSAQQRLSTSKRTEIKVKPYTSLQQQKPKEEDNKSVASHVAGMYPEDSMDRVALQVEVSSSEAVSSTVIKQQQPDTSSDMLSYIIDETIQNNLESNDNANVILNGETVMLLQKSPNSNLYIINKAAVDNLSNSKLNYNSDEEDASKLAEYEDSKCCQQGISIKHDPDGVRGIKPDPDYGDIKSGSLIGHDESKLQNQSGYELHYAGYPVPPGSYCTYPSIHHSAAGCACVTCVYCRPLPFYLPATHATQSVQTNSSVQEKRSKQKTDAAMMAKLYDEQMHSGKDKSLLDGKQQHQEQVGEAKQVISRFEHVDYYLPATHATQTVQMNPAVQDKRSNKKTDAVAKSANLYDDQLINSSLEKNLSDGKHPEKMMEERKEMMSKFEQLDSTLPLKKRLKAQRMSMDFGNREVLITLKNKAVSSIYPGELMMPVDDVDGQGNNSPLDLGAVVEVTSAMEKPVKSRAGRKEKTMNTKVNNQNVPDCFPRKAGNKKKRVGSTDEEVENSGVSAPKKSRKSNGGGAKQTRSSRRIVPTVNYYPEIDTECNPSGKRKKKRSNRWSTTKTS